MRIVSESFFYKNLGELKSYLVDTNRKLYKSNSDILNAILLADKTTLSQEDRYIFSDSGTSHIMAVSGLHVGIICSIMLIFIGKVNSYERLIILTCFLYFYNLLVGGGPSITRAISMTILSCMRSEEHTSELQSRQYLVCRLLLEKKKKEQKLINLKSHSLNSILTNHQHSHTTSNLFFLLLV